MDSEEEFSFIPHLHSIHKGSMKDKICDICAASIRENIKEKWEYFYKTGDQLNFTKDPRYAKYYTRY